MKQCLTLCFKFSYTKSINIFGFNKKFYFSKKIFRKQILNPSSRNLRTKDHVFIFLKTATSKIHHIPHSTAVNQKIFKYCCQSFRFNFAQGADSRKNLGKTPPDNLTVPLIPFKLRIMKFMSYLTLKALNTLKRAAKFE